MPEGDGGEAGDGSEVGDAELRELESCHPERSESAPADERQSKSLPEPCRRDLYRSTATTPIRPWRRATICVSSQVGCAVDCAFCMTALLGLKRNLSAGEIVGQVLTVLNDQQVDVERDRINLVFMGQGEPFLNYDNFMQAVRLLVEEAGIPGIAHDGLHFGHRAAHRRLRRRNRCVPSWQCR